MILIGIGSIIGDDGEPTGRHCVVLCVNSRPGEALRLCDCPKGHAIQEEALRCRPGEALRLCDCPEGHATQEEALRCQQVQETLKQIVKNLRDARSDF